MSVLPYPPALKNYLIYKEFDLYGRMEIWVYGMYDGKMYDIRYFPLLLFSTSLVSSYIKNRNWLNSVVLSVILQLRLKVLNSF